MMSARTPGLLRRLHPVAGVLALALILGFWLATATSEVLLGHDAVLAVKTGILYAMALLVPAMATVGATGFRLGGRSQAPLVAAKRRRMPVIALNGLLVLVPCALFLQARAAAGTFDGLFYAVQALELVAGALNIALLSLSLRDGLKLAAGRRGTAGAPLSPARPGTKPA